MKIALITVTLNDDCRFKKWCEYYEEYKDEVDLHIIVDNHSTNNYLQQVKNYFTNSIIIERSTNGGCTGAYNDGIKYALSNPEINAICLLANDIKLQPGALSILRKLLFSQDTLGIVAPITLMKDSNIVEHFGSKISKYLTMIPYESGKKISEVDEEINYCEAVSGGANMAKRGYYEKLGLQDEVLFMYSDEVEMGLRAKNLNILMATTKEAVCWHQHINDKSTSKRQPYTKYLAGRNKVYIAKKHFGSVKSLCVFSVFFFGAWCKVLKFVFIGRFSQVQSYGWMMLGALMGLIGNMCANKYSQPSGSFQREYIKTEIE